MTTSTSSAGTEPDLKRAIGPKLLLLFIVGDILGTGVYALTGEVAGEVGGAGWAAVLLAFAVATVTAFSYLELVTKYPQAAGAALYTHKAFGVHVLTFLVTFAVLSSGLTSASTAAKFLAENVIIGFDLDWGPGAVTMIALAFITLLALINLRGVAESLAFNVVLTLIELTGLLIVILIGFWAMSQGNVDLGRATVFETSEDKTVLLALTSATALAFFSMVGFEDSVNMAEETKDPVRIFPRVMLTGLTLTAAIYVLVSITAVAVVPVGELADSTTPLLEVVRRGAPGLPVDVIYPFLSIFAVANTALINLMMASRLVYGMAQHEVLPPFLGRVLPGRRSPWAAIVFTTLLTFGLVWGVTQVAGEETITALGGTTALLLLAVFAVVNVAAIVLRRRPVERDHFHAPKVLPYVGALTCAFLVGPWAQDPIEYQIAGGLIAIGLVLWLLTWAFYRRGRPPLEPGAAGD
ncbi:amino acid/polyamine/organocation transporter, APC superfamily [Georgenia satyanarayanai]|uniref:Amino acid/polyamine/organocation transporter, APC superfamily n=1 Tax=Georgenia satyanarayanai TaxID=860221 RepID=A0A2Y9AKC6_9MICO|nr:APC family permease [Georgenia satyanarayanai]PYF98368.1 amino acid/polyamine/organocation transporter (APC superfamily) [Georgenia satyanarayanai]SSA44971.1 amino acid/polyamine/organocation transporter, APC superfamily [Georgenia satyanarayanai]